MDHKRWETLFRQMSYSQSPPKEPSESRRHHSRALPARQRASSFEEVDLGLSAEETHEECCRCLRCDATAAVSR
jgi:hypothetical protein